MKEADLGQVDIDQELERRQCPLYTPNWFSAEVKTGVREGEGERKRGKEGGRVREREGEGNGQRGRFNCVSLSNFVCV